MTGAIRSTGVLRRERTVATGELSVELSTPGSGSLVTSTRIEGAFALVPQQRPMVRIDGVSTASGGVLFMRDAGMRWISLPFDDSPSPQPSPASLHVDRQWIGLQASAVEVRQDYGIETVGGISLYRYSVALKQEALDALIEPEQQELRTLLRNQLSGEIWIDAKSFVLRRATWALHDAPLSRGEMTLRVDVSIFDHNVAKPSVQPPLSDAIEYPDDGVFATIFSGALLPFLSW